MLDVKKTKSDNFVNICGVLNELDITTGTSADGKDWIRGTAVIKCDQDINGVATECLVPVKMFSMRLKKDGDLNKVYDRILGYREKFTSEAVADDDHPASRITVTGELEENIWLDKTTGAERSTFQISSNFLNEKKDGDEEGAKFRLTGVVLNDPAEADETDKEGNPTGRKFIKLGVIGFGGKINVITLFASGSQAAHIESHWTKEETVKVAGKVNITHKVEKIKEEQGFGEPVFRNKTTSHKELIITGGSASGLEEEFSYDRDSVMSALNDRKSKIAELKESNTTAKASPKSKSTDFGF